jgi:hypothetical protein
MREGRKGREKERKTYCKQKGGKEKKKYKKEGRQMIKIRV